MITTDTLAARMDGLAGIGIGPDGVRRLAWTEEDALTRAWFEEQAAGVGLRVERDPAGNLWACPEVDPPWWGVGSHLDSVRGGGLFDGPLGVACAFEIAAGSGHPIAVLSFADEEGARFNTPTFGSKALAGRLDLPAVLERRDDAGVSLREAMRAGGVDPDAIDGAPEWLRTRLAGFIEIHIDQTTELARAGEPVGVVSGLAARTRLEVRLTGRADHAGTTPRLERRDALSAAARLIVGAEDAALAGSSLDGDHAPLTVTASRIITKPNAPTTIAAEVRVWIDARAPAFAAIDAWRARVDSLIGELADRTGVEIEVTVASRSDPREFAPALRGALTRAAEDVLDHAPPELVCFAGHDAGVVAERIPAAMLFVRNATGVSHSPEETVSLDDAAVAARVVARALESLA
ncbi:MAG TPA: Zn-dependent hydrolase [Solirubrobacteraceae bacterium]|nr:Zn-dependent hydrolase [Solirubrobacteraceae bacterium]